MDQMEITLDWSDEQQKLFVNLIRGIIGKRTRDSKKEHKSVFRPDFTDKDTDSIWRFVERKIIPIFDNSHDIISNLRQFSQTMHISSFQDILDDLDEFDEDADGESCVMDFLQDRFKWSDNTAQQFQKLICMILTIKDNNNIDDVEDGTMSRPNTPAGNTRPF